MQVLTTRAMFNVVISRVVLQQKSVALFHKQCTTNDQPEGCCHKLTLPQSIHLPAVQEHSVTVRSLWRMLCTHCVSLRTRPEGKTNHVFALVSCVLVS